MRKLIARLMLLVMLIVLGIPYGFIFIVARDGEFFRDWKDAWDSTFDRYFY